MNKIEKKISLLLIGLGVFITPNLSYSMQDFDFLTKINDFDDKEKIEFIKENIDTINKQKYLKAVGEIFETTEDNLIDQYANREKRIVSPDEEKLIAQIKAMPPYMYQYIGPYLHETPGISEKVLNMPGIKETKGTFPTRIAPHLKDFVKKHKQFLSTRLYYLLMPEVWANQKPKTIEKLDLPKQKTFFINTKIDNNLIKKALSYFTDAYFDDNKLDTKQLRSIGEITKDSKLTTGDARAFLNTMTDLRELEKDKDYNEKIYNAKKALKSGFDNNVAGLSVSTLKDMINPCQRLASTVKFANEENKFKTIISKQGFTIDEWAYTCDKTIKAHRLAHAYPAIISFIQSYKKGYYQKLNMLQIKPIRETIDTAQKMFFELYQAPVEDVVAVRNLKNEISDEFVGKDNEYLFNYPIVAIY